MKTRRLPSALILLFSGSVVFQGCPISSLLGGILSDCFGEDTISSRQFEDLNTIEQLLWEENDCGRYERRSL